MKSQLRRCLHAPTMKITSSKFGTVFFIKFLNCLYFNNFLEHDLSFWITEFRGVFTLNDFALQFSWLNNAGLVLFNQNIHSLFDNIGITNAVAFHNCWCINKQWTEVYCSNYALARLFIR